MGDTLLATAGDTIKLWDASTYAFYQEIPFENGHVNGLSWNQDGHCLASLGDSGEEILLSAICGKSDANIGVVRGIEAPTCVKFACRCPHYLGVGSASGTVAVWNVKSQTKKKVFTPTDLPITKIAFSHSDSHIAAATKKGTLYMLSVMNNLAAGPYQLFSNQVVTDLTYSQVRKSLLGCCSEGGIVNLYDTHANKVLHSFSAHSSPVAAVCFSPVNELLMVSVGYDKMLSCYNVQTRQPVMTHRSTAPLTSVTFLGLGQLVALGTMTGQVLVHDMRNIRSPVAAIRAHRSAVTSVLLQPCLRSKSASSSKTSGRTNIEATLTVAKQKPSKSCSDQPTELSPDIRPNPESLSEDHKLDLSVFSPIRDTNVPTQVLVKISQADGLENQSGFNIDSPMEVMATESVFSPIRTTDPWQTGSPLPTWMATVTEDNVLSPVRDVPCNENSDRDMQTHQMKPCSIAEGTVCSPDVMDKENNEPSVGVTNEHSSALPPPFTVPCIINSSQKEASSVREVDSQAPSHLTTSPSASSNTISSPPKKRQLLRRIQASDLAPDMLPTQPEAGAPMDVALGGTTADVPVASPDVPRLQMELVRNCMVDVLEEFRDEFNSRLMHLQYIITKKFIEQQEVMQQLHRQYSLNEDLIKENEKLRQQVAHLQANY